MVTVAVMEILMMDVLQRLTWTHNEFLLDMHG